LSGGVENCFVFYIHCFSTGRGGQKVLGIRNTTGQQVKRSRRDWRDTLKRNLSKKSKAKMTQNERVREFVLQV